MPIQKRHQRALSTLHDITTAKSKQVPGDSSLRGFRRIGLRVPVVRAIVKEGYAFLEGKSRAEILDIWHQVFNNTDIYEVACQAIYYYQHKSLTKGEFNAICKWINRCDCWEHSDDLSKIYARVFEENPEWVMPWYRKWNISTNLWKRRQSVVGLMEYAQRRKSVQPFDVLTSFIEPLLEDDEHYVQKGVGWTLREIYNVYPSQTLTFIRDNLSIINPLAYSAATEKLDKPAKAKLNRQRKTARRSES
jgi:3-methyladenine DNA glycosylase AlkD